jgi:hypothetical protein
MSTTHCTPMMRASSSVRAPQLIPVIEALSSSALKHYHWSDIAAVLGHEIVVDNSLTLSKFIGWDIVAHLVAVQQVAHVAKKVRRAGGAFFDRVVRARA